jgi:hypothetical protein
MTALSLLLKSVGLAAADAAGLAPGKAAEWVSTLEARVTQQGKYSKFSVMYLPVQPPPLFWRYSCDNCRFWTEPNGCTLVEGFIAAGGWCGIFMPKDGDRPFSWPTQFLQDVPTRLAEAPQAFQNWFDQEDRHDDAAF